VGEDGVLVHNISNNNKARALAALMQLSPGMTPVETPDNYNPHPEVTEDSPTKEKVRPKKNKRQGSGAGKGKGRGGIGKNRNGGRTYPKIPPKKCGL